MNTRNFLLHSMLIYNLSAEGRETGRPGLLVSQCSVLSFRPVKDPISIKVP